MSFCGLGGTKTNRKQKRQPKIHSSIKPQSNIIFGANDYKPNEMLNQNSYIPIDLNQYHSQNILDGRASNYADQIPDVQNTNKIANKQLLNYQLDIEGGITETPIINTFHYDTVLNHSFAHMNNPS